MTEDAPPQKAAPARDLERESRRLERVRLLTAVPDLDAEPGRLPAHDDDPGPKEAA